MPKLSLLVLSCFVVFAVLGLSGNAAAEIQRSSSRFCLGIHKVRPFA